MRTNSASIRCTYSQVLSGKYVFKACLRSISVLELWRDHLEHMPKQRQRGGWEDVVDVPSDRREFDVLSGAALARPASRGDDT